MVLLAIPDISMPISDSDNLPYENDYPFEIPNNWLWLKHNDLFEISGGSQPPKAKFINEPKAGYIRLFQIRDYGDKPAPVYIPEATATKTTKKGDILLARYGASLGKVFWAENGAYNVAMAKVIPLYEFLSEYIFDKYLFYYYHTDLYRSVIMGNSRSAQAGFNKDDLENMWFPVPPIAEQKRIVNCIEQILPLVDLYGVHEQKLIKLNDQFSDLLKKSILQEAVQGKLVPQDPNDEPASVLLERIRAEKEQLIKAGKIKRDKHESIIFRRDNSHYEKCGSEVICIDDTIPFDIPDTWAWVRLRSVLEQASTGPFGSMLHKDDYTEKGIPIVNPANIADRRVIEYKIKRVSDETADRLKSYMLHSGDVIIGRRGEMGRSAVVLPQQEGWLCGTGCFYVTPLSGLSPEYLSFLLSSPYIRNALTDNSVGTTMNNLNHNILGDLLIPLPPVNEQIQIMQQYKNVINIFGD